MQACVPQTPACGHPEETPRPRMNPMGSDLAGRLASLFAWNATALVHLAAASRECREAVDAVQGRQCFYSEIVAFEYPDKQAPTETPCSAQIKPINPFEIFYRVCRRASAHAIVRAGSRKVTTETMNEALRAVRRARHVTLSLRHVAGDLSILRGVPRVHLQRCAAVSDLRPLAGVRWLKVEKCPNLRRLPVVAKGATVILDCKHNKKGGVETLEGLELAHSVAYTSSSLLKADQQIGLEPLAKVHRVHLEENGFRDLSPLRNAHEVCLADVALRHGKYDFTNVFALKLLWCNVGEADEGDNARPFSVGNVVALQMQVCRGIRGMRIPPSVQRLSVWATGFDEPDLEAPVCASWVALRELDETRLDGLRRADHLILIDFQNDMDKRSGLDGSSIGKVELWDVEFTDVAPFAGAKHVVIDHCKFIKNLEALNKVPTVEIIGAQLLGSPAEKLERAVCTTTDRRWAPNYDMPAAHDFWNPEAN